MMGCKRGFFTMKDISKITWIIMISSFLLLTIMIGTTTKLVQKYTYKDAIAVEINSEQIEAGMQLEKESRSADHFTSYKSYPTTSIEAVDESIHKWVNTNDNEFLDRMNKLEEDENILTARYHLVNDVNNFTYDLYIIHIHYM